MCGVLLGKKLTFLAPNLWNEGLVLQRSSCTWAPPRTCSWDSRVGFGKGDVAWLVAGLQFPLSRITGLCIPYCIYENYLMLWIIQETSRLLGCPFNLVLCFAFEHIHFQTCGFQMATTVISLRHNSIKESLMKLHIFWFICRNSLSRIITISSCEFLGLQTWNVFSMDPHNFSC